MIHANCIFSVCRCIASAFSQLPVLAIQGFRLEKVCRCTEHGVRSLFMFRDTCFSVKKGVSLHRICLFPTSGARDTGFSARKGVSLRGTWRSVVIYVRDTFFSVKKGVSLHSISTSPSFCARDTGFSARKGVSLRGTWRSVVIYVRDTFFSVKKGVSLTASVLLPLSVLAIQVFSLEMVCRCMEYGLRPLFMLATHGLAAEMVCR